MNDLVFNNTWVTIEAAHYPKAEKSMSVLDNIRVEEGFTDMGVSFSCFLWVLNAIDEPLGSVVIRIKYLPP